MSNITPSVGGGYEIEVFESSATWTNTASQHVIVDLISGGAGGTDGDGGDGPGVGGGGGGRIVRQFPVEMLPDSVTVTVGAGGPPDGDGGTSSFGQFLSMPGAQRVNSGGYEKPTSYDFGWHIFEARSEEWGEWTGGGGALSPNDTDLGHGASSAYGGGGGGSGGREASAGTPGGKTGLWRNSAPNDDTTIGADGPDGNVMLCGHGGNGGTADDDITDVQGGDGGVPGGGGGGGGSYDYTPVGGDAGDSKGGNGGRGEVRVWSW